MSNVKQLHPRGTPTEVVERLSAKGDTADIVVNLKTGKVSNLWDERTHLHKTLDETLASLHTMSVSQKCDTFESLAESMKQIFDLYIQATRDSMENK